MYFNKNKLLSNYELIEMCAKSGINLIDILNKDLLIKETPQEGCYIINLQDSGVGQGTHWVGLILNEEYVSYFDPFGLHHSEDVSRFISWFLHDVGYTDTRDVIYNTTQVQNINSILCGYYVFAFLYHHTVINKHKTNNKDLMGDFVLRFKRNGSIYNDKTIERMIKHI